MPNAKGSGGMGSAIFCQTIHRVANAGTRITNDRSVPTLARRAAVHASAINMSALIDAS